MIKLRIELMHMSAKFKDGPSKINLIKLAKNLEDGEITYDPPSFPGAILKNKRFGNLAIVVFHTGKIHCVGARTMEDLERAKEWLEKELNRLEVMS